MSGECLHELNAYGGFRGSHRRLCCYRPDCDADAVVHVGIVDRPWCGNVCKRCASRIMNHHRVQVDEQLKGLEVDDGRTT